MAVGKSSPHSLTRELTNNNAMPEYLLCSKLLPKTIKVPSVFRIDMGTSTAS